MLTGENGVLTKAREAKEETEIATYEEELKLIGNGLEAEQVDDSIFMERYANEIKADEMFKDAKKVKLSDDKTTLEVITKEGYIFEVTRDNVEYKGKDDGSLPEEPEIPELETGDITFICEPSTPTQGSVEVTIETSLELVDSWIEYSIDGSLWDKYESPITVTDNCEIYARISNSAGPSINYATGNVENIDRLEPKTFTPSATNTTNSITLTGSAEDAEATETDGCSGIDVYYFSIDGGEWEPENGQLETSYTFSGLVQGKDYTLKMKAVDKAGNERESVEITCTTGSVPGLIKDQNVTFSYSPTTFTRGNVTVTIETDISGYTLQYSIDGTASWQNYSTPIIMETNGIVHAKLVDNSGQEGDSASANITIIDKLDPIEPTLQVTEVTENSITVQASATDQAQTSEYASSGIKGYQFSKDDGKTWEPQTPQTSGRYTFNNLTENTSYTLKVKAIDNATNETEIENAITGTTEKGIIDTTTSYTANYADTNGDGTADGIIFADLAIGGSGTALGQSYSIPTASGLKEYYIANENYSDSRFGNELGKLIAPVEGTSGNDRFYIMALEDVGTTTYYWYYNAYENMNDYSSTTSRNFGTGKTNTENMIAKWNGSKYGSQNSRDMWGVIQGEINKNDKATWFVPSTKEWVAFAGSLGITSNYSTYGLSDLYWSSSLFYSGSAYRAYFNYSGIGNSNVNLATYVRLCATF